MIDVDDIDNDHDDNDINVLIYMGDTDKDIDFAVIHNDNVTADKIVNKVDTQIWKVPQFVDDDLIRRNLQKK